MGNKGFKRILKDTLEVLDDIGIHCHVDSMTDKVLAMPLTLKQFDDFEVLIRVYIDDQDGRIGIFMSPSNQIPETKTPIIMDLINRINHNYITEHVWLDIKTRDVFVMKGVLLTENSLDKEEFKEAFSAFLVTGVVMLRTIMEQVTSDEKPEVLIKSMFEKYAHCNDKCSKQTNLTLPGCRPCKPCLN